MNNKLNHCSFRDSCLLSHRPSPVVCIYFLLLIRFNKDIHRHVLEPEVALSLLACGQLQAPPPLYLLLSGSTAVAHCLMGFSPQPRTWHWDTRSRHLPNTRDWRRALEPLTHPGCWVPASARLPLSSSGSHGPCDLAVLPLQGHWQKQS